MPTEKTIVHYKEVTFWKEGAVGGDAAVICIDHPGPFPNWEVMYTDVVTSYDETTEIFETEDTIFVPAGPGLTN